MAVSNAERQRRYRAHKSGDHSLCDAERCDQGSVTVVTPRNDVTQRVPRLNSGGKRLWADLGGDDAVGEARVLIVEACRITDRLDKLDRQINDGEPWMTLKYSDAGDEVTVIVDKPLAEARQQATALKQLLADLRQQRGATAVPPARPAPSTAAAGPDKPGEAGNLVDFVAALTARRP